MKPFVPGDTDLYVIMIYNDVNFISAVFARLRLFPKEQSKNTLLFFMNILQLFKVYSRNVFALGRLKQLLKHNKLCNVLEIAMFVLA